MQSNVKYETMDNVPSLILNSMDVTACDVRTKACQVEAPCHVKVDVTVVSSGQDVGDAGCSRGFIEDSKYSLSNQSYKASQLDLSSIHISDLKLRVNLEENSVWDSYKNSCCPSTCPTHSADIITTSEVAIQVEDDSSLRKPSVDSKELHRLGIYSDSNNTLGDRSTSRSNTCESCGQELIKGIKFEEVKSIPSDHSLDSWNQPMTAFCRICHCEGDNEIGPLIAPCRCKGTLANVHHSCLQQWIKSSNCKSCELCGFVFAMKSKLKPFTKWEKLTISSNEKKKLICSILFHVVALTCVVWSLHVLIARTAEEIKTGTLAWPFWTKLIIVAIGFVGGLVFMYVQCKVYVQLWRRWKAFNRIIFVQHQPSNLESTVDNSNPILNGVSREEPHSNNIPLPACSRDDIATSIGKADKLNSEESTI